MSGACRLWYFLSLSLSLPPSLPPSLPDGEDHLGRGKVGLDAHLLRQDNELGAEERREGGREGGSG